MPALFVETDPAAPDGPRFSTDPRPLLALISFGVAEPFGTQHPLTEVIRGLKRGHGIDVGPLLTFYDRDVEDAEDAAKLDAAWQPAAALRDCVAAARAAIAAGRGAGRTRVGGAGAAHAAGRTRGDGGRRGHGPHPHLVPPRRRLSRRRWPG